ncbi:MAG: hypothetical protein KU37_04330 [Sulfuricurvum sp. PC08-66]|nr:MAG: hypothetical protein KU37_04330 [Sulfuricurvum sp. PC08-66]
MKIVMQSIKLFAVIVLFWTQHLFAQPLDVTNDQSLYDNFTLGYLLDANSSLTIDEVARTPFAKRHTNRFALGYQKGTLWFELSIHNQSAFEEFILTLNEHFYEKANLYYHEKGEWHQKHLGFFTPIAAREIKNSNLSFALTQPKGTTRTYYLELQGKYAYFGDIALYEKSYFYYDKHLDSHAFFIFMLGILTLIVLSNLFLYLQIREKIYLYYVGYSFFNFLYLLNISGLLVYVNLQTYTYSLQLSAAYMVAFLILFSREYLQTRTSFKLAHTLLGGIVYAFLVVGILVLFSYTPWNKIINNLSGLANVLLIIISLVLYRKGHIQTKYYIASIVVFFAFVVLFTAMVTGLLPYNNVTRYGFIAGLGVEAVVFLLILANRYNRIKKEHESYLEAQIAARTHDLQEVNTRLATLVEERELLLREVYHRVKNNFHMILGMFWFESKKEHANQAQFNELTNRIKAMSMIHEHLYTSLDLTSISLKSYLEKIIHNIISGYKISIAIHSHIEEHTIDFDHAVSLGIILNEIITNALKHNQLTPHFALDIEMTQKKERFFITVKDNGAGFDPTQNTQSLGLALVEQFCKKLHNSHYTFSFDRGTTFLLEFTA